MIFSFEPQLEWSGEALSLCPNVRISTSLLTKRAFPFPPPPHLSHTHTNVGDTLGLLCKPIPSYALLAIWPYYMTLWHDILKHLHQALCSVATFISLSGGIFTRLGAVQLNPPCCSVSLQVSPDSRSTWQLRGRLRKQRWGICLLWFFLQAHNVYTKCFTGKDREMMFGSNDRHWHSTSCSAEFCWLVRVTWVYSLQSARL